MFSADIETGCLYFLVAKTKFSIASGDCVSRAIASDSPGDPSSEYSPSDSTFDDDEIFAFERTSFGNLKWVA